MVSSFPGIGRTPSGATRSMIRPARRIAGLAAVLGIFLVPGGVLAGTGLALTEADSGTSVQSAKGAAITITLEANASTGYHWIEATKPDPAIVATDEGSGEFVAPDTALIGASGSQVFSYHAAGDGTTSMVLQYVAPGTGEVAKTFSVTIAVGPVAGMLDAVAPPPTSTDRAAGLAGQGQFPLALIASVALAGIAGLVGLRWRLAR